MADRKQEGGRTSGQGAGERPYTFTEGAPSDEPGYGPDREDRAGRSQHDVGVPGAFGRSAPGSDYSGTGGAGSPDQVSGKVRAHTTAYTGPERRVAQVHDEYWRVADRRRHPFAYVEAGS